MVMAAATKFRRLTGHPRWKQHRKFHHSQGDNIIIIMQRQHRHYHPHRKQQHHSHTHHSDQSCNTHDSFSVDFTTGIYTCTYACLPVSQQVPCHMGFQSLITHTHNRTVPLPHGANQVQASLHLQQSATTFCYLPNVSTVRTLVLFVLYTGHADCGAQCWRGLSSIYLNL